MIEIKVYPFGVRCKFKIYIADKLFTQSQESYKTGQQAIEAAKLVIDEKTRNTEQ
jgi:hypothetical protein